ncbi:hypothetical protein J2S19_000991 [Metabacillus malikii]|uniref:Uncharacterized protein n=1 Tax=Metabacillus malikii TaxID=1504265 RepID=A0ABT9ZBV7_9BACI|nr:hypothetical protein [Metabacillus malikii]
MKPKIKQCQTKNRLHKVDEAENKAVPAPKSSS